METLDAIIKGIGLGITLSILAGPAFFLLIYTSLRLGWQASLLFALGVWLSDFIYLTVAYLGVSHFLEQWLANQWVGLLVGLFIAVAGIVFILRARKSAPPPIITRKIKLRTRTQFMLFFQGFFLNLGNPFVIIYWVSLATVGSTFSDYNTFIFLLSILGGLIISDLLKIYRANYLTKFLTPRIMKLANVVLGIALAIAGMILAIRSILYLNS